MDPRASAASELELERSIEETVKRQQLAEMEPTDVATFGINQQKTTCGVANLFSFNGATLPRLTALSDIPNKRKEELRIEIYVSHLTFLEANNTTSGTNHGCIFNAGFRSLGRIAPFLDRKDR